jgi:predicted DCC family thiol-disulfide oxidoreductase YuxK
LQDSIYRWVADNRYRMPGSTAACEIEPERTN